MLEEINDIMCNLIIEKTYIRGDIDKFINEVIKRSVDEVAHLVELSDEDKIKRRYLIQIGDCVKSMGFINRVLQTKKIEQNRKDLIKLGKELLNIADVLISLGEEEI